MLVLGDVVATLAVIGGGALAAWGLMMLAAYLLKGASQRCAGAIHRSPWRVFFIGLAITAPVLAFSLVLASVPNPAIKGLGLIFLSSLFLVSGIGMGGMVRLLAGRIREDSADMSDYGTVSRAAMIITFCYILPFVGWFVLAPLALIFGVGASLTSLKPVRIAAPPLQAPEAP